MATTFAPNSSLLVNNSGGTVQSLPNVQVGGKLRFFYEKITLASQVSGSAVMVARIPVPSVLLGIIVESDTSLGSSTIAFGDANTSNLFAAAATFTTTDKKVEVTTTAGVGPITTGYQYNSTTARYDYEDILMTVAAANLPASGNLVVLTAYLDYSS